MSSITIQNGCFKLSETQTLDIPHLEIHSGESWAFIGANGSGKSSLARVLSGELQSLSGMIKLTLSRLFASLSSSFKRLLPKNGNVIIPIYSARMKTTQVLPQLKLFNFIIKITNCAQSSPLNLVLVTYCHVDLNISRREKPAKSCCAKP